MDNAKLTGVKFYHGDSVPLELHKVRIVQKLHLRPVEQRLQAIEAGGYNTFLLNTTDIFLDMLTDSGTNAMSDNQLSSMLHADDAYAGSQSFYRMEKALQDVFGQKYVLPVHQGRAAENVISRTFIRPGDVIPMNYHFTTTKAHMELNGGKVFEIYTDEALKIRSDHPFKGNIDIGRLRNLIATYGAEKIPFIRMEASTNLIGGQPFSIANMREVKKVAEEHGLMMVLDASLIGENAWFIKKREEEFAGASISTILQTMCGLADIVYFSSRKVSSTRGGGICTNNHDLFIKMRDLVPLFEGFLTYGGMSVREIEAMAVGLYETTDETVISQSPSFIEYAVNQLDGWAFPWSRQPVHWDVISMPSVSCRIFRRKNILPGRWPLPSSSFPGAGAWSAAPSPANAMKRGTISWPTWNCFAWPFRGAFSPYRRPCSCSTGSNGFTITVISLAD